MASIGRLEEEMLVVSRIGLNELPILTEIEILHKTVMLFT